MLKEREQLIHKITMLLDAVLIAVAFVLAYVVRGQLDFSFLQELPPFEEYVPMLLLVIPVWIVCMEFTGAYDSMRRRRFSSIFWGLVEASLFAIFIFSAAAFLMKWEILSRTFVVVLFLLGTLILAAERWGALYLLRRARRKGYNYRVLLIVGSGPRAEKFGREIQSHPEWGMRVLGYVDEPSRIGMQVNSGAVIGGFDDLPRLLDDNVVDEVVFLMPRRWLARLEEYIKACEKVGVKATVAVDFFDTAIARPVLQDMNGWPLLTFDSTPNDYFALMVKRMLDIAGALAGIVLLSPLFLSVAAAIRISSPGPVFFRQVRCGLNGRTFEILKFRTMVVDAEQKLTELRDRNEVGGPVFKIRNDPRITGIGRLLRRSSLDELPQLFNVLRGDMSLIGPRPPLPSEVEKYERWQRRRLSMRPGIACIHEVTARNNTDFALWMKMDLEYIDNWSLGLDVNILVRTVAAVIKGTGC